MLFTKHTVSLAFSLSFIALAHPAWSAAAPATKFPILPRMANQSATGVSPANSTQKYFAEALCTPAQKAIEQIAWDDARRYAQALASWRPNGSFQPAMDLYMGTDSGGPLSQELEGTVSDKTMLLDQERVPSFLSRANAGSYSEHRWCTEST